MNDWAKNAVTRLSSDIKTTKVTCQYKIPTGKVNKVFSLDFINFYLFYFICNTIITKNKGKERKKKKWWGDVTETIGPYERLGLLELRVRAVKHQLKKRWPKVVYGKN